MESECPHLGADLSHADIEEAGEEVVAVCPWHRWIPFFDAETNTDNFVPNFSATILIYEPDLARQV